jgi:citrate lyase subunit beta/citryl-CoA lyase
MTSVGGQVTEPPPAGPAVLFCPADRPDRYRKALARADTVIVDLEDAVADDRKQLAREALRAAAASLPVERTIVRINSPRAAEGLADVDLLLNIGLRYVMLPKAENPSEVDQLAPLSVISLCETARGIEAAYEIASAPGCVGLMWGGEDLTADIGGWNSRGPDGKYLAHVNYARSRVLIAASAARVPAWDGVFLDISDLDGLRSECDEAVAMGFAAKVAIHPSHIPVIREAYRPTAGQIAWADGLLAAVDAAESGVVNFRDRMVDGPLITMARAIAGRASATSRVSTSDEVSELCR